MIEHSSVSGNGVPFVHLSVHSEFSLQDSTIRIKKLMQQLSDSGDDAQIQDEQKDGETVLEPLSVAVTDLHNMFSLVKFYRSAMGAGIKPVAGVDARILNASIEDGVSRVILLVKNDAGYQQLTRLVSSAYQTGQQSGQPEMNRQALFDCDGLIVLSGGVDGEIGKALLHGQAGEAEDLAKQWQSAFGDRFYLEVRRIGQGDEDRYNPAVVALAAKLKIPLVATNDVRFLKADDHSVHEARLCIQGGYVLADSSRAKTVTTEQYLKTPRQMVELFADLPEALANSVEIAKRCNINLKLGTPVLPDFPIPEGLTENEYFAQETEAGLNTRLEQLFDTNDENFSQTRKAYDERLVYELDVISKMGFAGYFLIVADFIRWSRENDIPVGPGRGSGAGSLVAYSLAITDIDPLAYDLLFERFLNVERVSMPDFDIDFCMDGRDRVIQYVSQQYGEHRVSQIITYGTMAAKAVVRDVGRVMSHPYGFVDRIAKMVPFEVGMTLTKALAESDELSNAYRDDEEVTELLDMALALEGLSRNAGKHAGGVVIAPTALTDFAPLYCEADGSSLVTQFDKDDAEAVGLVKFDFLGLRTLTIIDNAVKTVNQLAETPLDIMALPLDDKATYKLLQNAKTTAVFQLESDGMKGLIERLQPDSFEDIIALVALYRPGPLQSGMVDDFIDRKHGRKQLAWPHEDYQLDILRPVLEPTYGVILYQEQVMQIAQVMAGYSLGTADILRRAMGKKKPEEMAKQRAVFLDGCSACDIDVSLAGNIFDLVEKFAGYGFNKSHSAAYALLSYQTAWLKQHHPAAFMCAVLSADMDNTDKVVLLIDECKSMGLTIESPDINESDLRFTVENETTIRYGLGAIKGVGESALRQLLEDRNNNGLFTDLPSMCRRVEAGSVNKRVLEVLIVSGALDKLAPNRASLLNGLPSVMQGADQFHRDASAGQDDMFGLVNEEAPAVQIEEVAEWPEKYRLTREKDALGFYLSGHPINACTEELAQFTGGKLADLCKRVGNNAGQAANGGGWGKRQQRGTAVILAGLNIRMRTRDTSRGRMGFITLDDQTAQVDVILDGEGLERFSPILTKDEILVVDGDLFYDDFNRGYSIRARELYDLSAARARFARTLLINLREQEMPEQSLDRLLSTLSEYRPGRTPVCFEVVNQNATARIQAGSNWLINPAAELLDDLSELAGADSVTLQY